MLRQTLPLFLVLAPIVAHAQTQASVLIQSGAQIQIPVPPGADKPRIQILLAGSNTILDDERANVQGGVATARLEADPGTYDVRLASGDKNRTPIGPVRTFQIPGFKREAGRWLFNGSAVAYEGANAPTLNSVLPTLRRDKKAKLPASAATNTAVKWDLQSFGTEFAASLQLSGGETGTYAPSIANTKADFQKAQAQREANRPNGALLLSMPYQFSLWQGSYIDALSPLVDGIVLNATPPAGTENLASEGSQTLNSLIKIARRNAEETPNFDLPVFARFSASPSPSDVLRAFQSGASNIIVPEGTSNPVLDTLASQSARFSGAVTIEDTGLRIDDFNRFAPYLRRAGRVPLLGRLPGEGNGDNKDSDKNVESVFVSFSPTTDTALLDKIERAAKAGATIYCEGALPPALLPRWSDITKTQIAPLATPHKGTVTFSEPWFWGTLNDQNFDATQTVAITIKPSIAAQTRDVKGEARETVARPIARFNDDPNAIMLCPVNKGRIIWTPFDISSAGRVRLALGSSNPFVDAGDFKPVDSPVNALATMSSSLLISYYAAIAGAMQPALVEYTATKGNPSNISAALRAIPADPKNPRSSAISLIALFNSSNDPIDLDATMRGDGTYVLDLMTNKMVPSKVRDFGVRIALTVPANGYRWIALAKDEQAWNDAGKNGAKARLN